MERKGFAMNIELRLSSEDEQALRKHIASTGGDVETYVSDVVAESLQSELQTARNTRTRPGTFAERLRAWAERHPRLDHEIDVSRESIYAGRGE